MVECLYHGSSNKDLTDLILPGTVTNKSQRDLVFATPDENLAALYSLTGGPGDFIVDHDGKRIFSPKTSSELIRRDRGGTVYSVSLDGLQPSDKPNMASEWTGSVAEIVDKNEINSALAQLHRAGYRIFADFELFCDVEENVLGTGEFPQSLIEQHRSISLPRIVMQQAIRRTRGLI